MKNYNEQIFNERLKSFLFSAADYIQNEPGLAHRQNSSEDYKLTAADFCQELGELIPDMFCASVIADDDGLSVNFSNGAGFRVTVKSLSEGTA